MNKKINIAINDDYATMSTYNYGFYYGYEFDSKEDEDGDTIDIFGFEVDDNSTNYNYRISYEEMSKFKNCPNQWECDKCLLFGIGLYLEYLKENK